jgi:sensor domain CHASE-containing protein
MPGRLASLSLQQKVSVTLLVVMSAMGLLSYLVLSTTVAPAFDNLELASAEKNIARVEKAIQNDLRNLSAIVGDWAPWDDAHAFARGENPGFPKSNLDLATMINLDVDLVIIYDVNGTVLWSHLLRNGEKADYSSLGVLNKDNPQSAALIYHTRLDSRVEGLVQTGLGPMQLSSQPIITSSKAGPVAGTMLMGRFFDTETMAALQERTEVSLTWHLLGDSSIDAALEERIVSAPARSFSYSVTDHEIQAFSLLSDLFGEPMMILQANTPRQISALGNKTVDGALLFLLGAGIVVAVVTWFLLRRIIVLPLERLANHITGIRESGDLSLRLNESRHDELGALAHEFDKMTLEVHDARRQLLDQSFKAGKADTAAEVLHNIRNAMTPLINGIDRLSKNFRFASGLRVQQATEELASPACQADRRDKLLQYIASAFGHVQKTSEDAITDLQVASKQARQVEAILSDQERYANVAPVIENLELQAIVEEAALVIPHQNQPGILVDVQPGLDHFQVRAHRVGLVQVLGNLILNAYESIKRAHNDSGTIRVTASREIIDGEEMVRLTVSDTGSGFADEVRNNIFQRGFSSKEGHQRGLGLHWCANALSNMGGRIAAESEGTGLGAAFHVLLPAGGAGRRADSRRPSDTTAVRRSTARIPPSVVADNDINEGPPNEYATG